MNYGGKSSDFKAMTLSAIVHIACDVSLLRSIGEVKLYRCPKENTVSRIKVSRVISLRVEPRGFAVFAFSPTAGDPGLIEKSHGLPSGDSPTGIGKP